MDYRFPTRTYRRQETQLPSFQFTLIEQKNIQNVGNHAPNSASSRELKLHSNHWRPQKQKQDQQWQGYLPRGGSFAWKHPSASRTEFVGLETIVVDSVAGDSLTRSIISEVESETVSPRLPTVIVRVSRGTGISKIISIGVGPRRVGSDRRTATRSCDCPQPFAKW